VAGGHGPLMRVLGLDGGGRSMVRIRPSLALWPRVLLRVIESGQHRAAARTGGESRRGSDEAEHEESHEGEAPVLHPCSIPHHLLGDSRSRSMAGCWLILGSQPSAVLRCRR
jgi:hypothetical protein